MKSLHDLRLHSWISGGMGIIVIHGICFIITSSGHNRKHVFCTTIIILRITPTVWAPSKRVPPHHQPPEPSTRIARAWSGLLARHSTYPATEPGLRNRAELIGCPNQGTTALAAGLDLVTGKTFKVNFGEASTRSLSCYHLDPCQTSYRW